jgi:hypothetical protein
MNEFVHLSESQLIQALDGELSSAAQIEVDLHLANCETCLERYESYAAVSETISRAIEAEPVAGARLARQQLAQRLNEAEQPSVRPPNSRRFLWAWAAAACFALVLLFAGYRAQTRHAAAPQSKATEALPASSFIRLPYSDPSLPLESADVIRVRMRASTLANAGIIRVSPNTNDGWVQADVLLGIDGEPRGIRLISAQSDH